MGTVEGITVQAIHNSRSSGCVVRESLADHSQHTGDFVTVRMIDASATPCPVVMVTIASPFFSGRVHTTALFDLIIGNTEDVRDSCGKDAATQIEQQNCAAVTRAQTKEVRSKIPLIVILSDELLNSADFAEAQNSDPVLSNIHKRVPKGASKTYKWDTTRLWQYRGKINKEALCDHSEARTFCCVFSISSDRQEDGPLCSIKWSHGATEDP